MKSIFITLVLCCIVILSGCSSEKDHTIEYQTNRIDDLETAIEECNNNIEEAQSYAGESYEDMEYALSNLETCDYY